ncbi:hypothetical protein D9M69_543460 [compost metagenome]
MMEAMIAICSGVEANRRAVAAGIIRSDVISKIPTIFIEMAITIASSSMKMMRDKAGFKPSARAISSLTVAASSGRHNHASTASTRIPPP